MSVDALITILYGVVVVFLIGVQIRLRNQIAEKDKIIQNYQMILRDRNAGNL